jgi:hypothetical protein
MRPQRCGNGLVRFAVMEEETQSSGGPYEAAQYHVLKLVCIARELIWCLGARESHISLLLVLNGLTVEMR